MKYVLVKDIVDKWKISERSVRDYCAKGRIPGAYLSGKTWMIPFNSVKPTRIKRKSFKEETLIETLKREKDASLKGGIYHKIQIELTYNSNHIEGSKLTHDETRYIFETRTIGLSSKKVSVDDIIETVNHFRCVDLVIDFYKAKLSESFIKELHLTLKMGTSDSNKSWFKVGDYKLLENEVGGKETTPVEEVKTKIKELLNWYNLKENITFNDIIEFHYLFESIHPFQDGNGRVGRLIMLKECLKHNIVPPLIRDEDKLFYYRGLSKWEEDKTYLIDTCLRGQDITKEYLDYFKIKY